MRLSYGICKRLYLEVVTWLAWHAGGERYLDTRAGSLYWWQLHLLDVYLVLLIGLVLVSSVLLGALYLLFTAVCHGWRHSHQE